MFVLQILVFVFFFVSISVLNHIISAQRKAREAERQLARHLAQQQAELAEEEEYEEPDEDEPPAEPRHRYGYEYERPEEPPHENRNEYERPEEPPHGYGNANERREVPVQVPLPPQREVVEWPPRAHLVLPGRPAARELLHPAPLNQFRSPWVHPNQAYARRRFDNSRRQMFQPLTPQNPLRGPLQDT